MPTNLKAYDKFMELSRQLLPWTRRTSQKFC